ncbi:WD domain, G-beta repeat [Carpediemonas membranifera]|uniref:WD domain, G-beta repeat n=1 Tax=Carpediemonas membranifera TaxID=201153 RepID=A0A8J6B405_9EUKA|nr:WD domain, G-beta repeat [Carpediemonas membranifera]|eukprot:KAG9389562.1 WD domain, G-beta repeat [Carpediemonas membranifera]
MSTAVCKVENAHPAAIWCLDYRKGHLLTADAGNNVKVWNWDEEHSLMAPIMGTKASVHMLGINACQLCLAKDTSGARAMTLGLDGYVRSFSLNPDAPDALCASQESLMENLPAYNSCSETTRDCGWTLCVDVTGKAIIGTKKGGVRVVELPKKAGDTATELQSLQTPLASVRCAALAQTGLLALGGADGQVVVFEQGDSSWVRKFSTAAHNVTVRALCFSADNTRLLTAADNGVGVIFDSHDGAVVATLNGHRSSIYSCAWSPNGQYIATGDATGQVIIWDASNGDMLASIEDGTKGVWGLTFTESSERIIVADGAGYIRVHAVVV